ncbi:MAG: glycosyltransferase family 2 protein [Candidatus Levyibacteriota bacterium]|nr:MAG: glycosyltransferase family 2 protein [Candidatus Levybacteria bacterium]
MKSLPTISIVTCLFNSDLIFFRKGLSSIENQHYPKKLIEHIVMDGGSTNGSMELAKKYGCKVFIRKDLLEEAQERMAIGIKKAKNDLILILEADNILSSRNWLMEMIQPFLADKRIFCTYSAYYGYNKSLPATTRYSALFGTPEPTVYFLKKNEKISIVDKHYDKGEILGETKNYFVVRFKRENLPVLGDNGSLFLRSAMEKVNIDPEVYAHPDAFAKLLDLGYDTFGVVKNGIIHIANPNILGMVKGKLWLKKVYYDHQRYKRIYYVFSWRSKKDIFNVMKFIFFSITIIIPIFEAVRGFIKIRDLAWFLHPVICLAMLFGYGWSEILWIKKRLMFSSFASQL